MAQQDAAQLDQLLKEGNNQFTAKMYSEVVKSNPNKSMVMSALSVLTPLAQLSLASVGTSHDKLLKAIGLPNDDATKAVFSRMTTKLQSVKGIELKTANKIYTAAKAEMNPEFSTVIGDVFNSEVKNVDFTKNIEITNEINSWVEDQTNHRIKDLVSAYDLDASTQGIFVNAIYFKGKWDSPFKEEDTKEEDFHVSKEQTIKVPMMHIKSKFRFADSSELNAYLLELPYRGHEVSFIVILPKKVNDGLAALEEKLKNPANLEKATSQMKIYDVTVSVLKFKIETKIDLKDVLKNIDVKCVFDAEQAQLSRLLKNEYNLFVNKAIQKAFIEVNEVGAEASAVNKVMVLAVSTGQSPPTSSFIADKPFYYTLNIGRITMLSRRYIQ